MSPRSKWLLVSGTAGLVVIVTLVTVLTGVFSEPTFTSIGQTVHVIDKGDYLNRSADITMNSIRVASDDSLCNGSASNTLGEWVVVDITVTNTSDESFPMNPGGFQVRHADGSDANQTSLTSDDCFPADNLLGVTVRPGETEEVQLALDTDTADGILTYDPVVQQGGAISWSFPSE